MSKSTIAAQALSSMGYFFLRMIFNKEYYSESIKTELSSIAEELMEYSPDSDLLDAIKTEFAEGDYLSEDPDPYEIARENLQTYYGYDPENIERIIDELRWLRCKDTPIVALIGRSGVGKTSVADFLERNYGWQQVESYTTRPKRSENERGHRFISKKKFDTIPKENLMAYMEYCGYRYGATNDQLDDAELYVVDPDGFAMLRRKYKNRRIISIKLTASKDILLERMRKRGTSEQEIADRMATDDEIFDHFKADIEINTDKRPIKEVGEIIITKLERIK